MVGGDLPGLIILQAAMRQRCLGPAGIDKADAIVFVGHVGGSHFDNATVHIHGKGTEAASRLD